MNHLPTVTPVGSNGYELPSTTDVASQNDMNHPDFGELLPRLIPDWVDVALEFDELGRIDAISGAEREQLSLAPVRSRTITATGEVSE